MRGGSSRPRGGGSGARRTGEWLQHPCRGGGGSRGGDAKGGCPERARREERPPPRRAEPPERAPSTHGLAAPIVPRAPLCPLRTRRLHGVPGSTRAARGRGGSAEWNGPRRRRPPAPLARCAGPAPPPGAAMERPGPPEGSAEPAVGSALALGRAAAGHGSACTRGCQSRSRGRGLEGDAERGAGGRRSPRSEGRCLRSLQMELGRPAVPATAGADREGPRRQGAQRSLPRCPRRGSRFPLPRSWRRARRPGCAPGLARGLPGRPQSCSPGRSALLVTARPLSLLIVNASSHADFALALSVSCAATLVRALCVAA